MVGCKKYSNDSRCIKSIGIDGSKRMIEKAMKLEKKMNMFVQTC